MVNATKEEQRPGGAIRFAWGAYQQLAAVLGAFSMAVFVGEVFDLGWHGILAKLVGIWSEYVRPVAEWLLDWVVWPFNYFFDWHVEIPLVVRDYLSVGLILALSFLRTYRSEFSWRDAWGDLVLMPFSRKASMEDRLVYGPYSPVLLPFIWPITVVLMMVFLVASRDKGMLYSLLPVLYLGLLLAVNAWLL